MNVIAVSHPGKIGDALYCLPAIRFFCESWNAQAHFYTSDYCKPMKKLMEYQSCIDHTIIPPAYEILRTDIGIQPWQMPIDRAAYKRVVQMGFRSVPNGPIPIFIAAQCGAHLRKLPRVYYEYPEIETLDEPYICIAPRGETTYKGLFLDVAYKSPVAVVIIGGHIDSITDREENDNGKPIIDLTGMDMLETTSWLAGSVGFVGLMSAMLVLANGFSMIKIAPHDGIHWDMRHVINSSTNFYPINPTLDEVRRLLKL